MRIILFILLFGSLLGDPVSYGQSGNYWTLKSDFFGRKRERMVGFSIGDKGYLATGVNNDDVVMNDLWEYEASTDSWTQKADLPASVRRNAIAFTIGSKAYVGTGMDSANASGGHALRDLWEYDPAGNTWVAKADFPGAAGAGIYFSTALSMDQKAFVIGGKISAATYSDEVWEYKPLTNEWLQHSKFPGGPRYQLTSFVVQNRAFAGLGVDYNVYKSDIWEYHPATDSWTKKSDFAGGTRGSVTSFTLGELAYICLGSDGGLKDDLWEYDPSTDNWSARAGYGGSARKCASAFVINGKAYVGTGNGYSGKKQSMYEYTPLSPMGILASTILTELSVYPYPVTDYFTIQNTWTDDLVCSLYSLDGTCLMKYKVPRTSVIQVGREHIQQGIYLLIAKDQSGKTKAVRKMLFL